MAASFKLKNPFPFLKSLLQLQRLNHTFVEGGLEAELLTELGPKTMGTSGRVDTSKWKKVDSRDFGITQLMIPDSPRIVVRILQSEGHDAYLVGGCVRDLLLNKIPKDYDVITTANLKEIKQKFHRAFIVGRRFPICRVHVRGSVVEVCSFETVSRDAKKKEEVHLSKMPKGYDVKDLMRWQNSLRRDFTINSLFYDPCAHKIYDYSSGMADLTSLKLRTLVPAHLSFQEDCARILRGLRIAARLGLSFAKDTEKAICNLYESVTTLDKARLMMEVNFMLSYGAAETSLLLLKRFNLLEVLLPFHAAYLTNHSGARTPAMLMKLFFNLDKVVSCDQPGDYSLWVSMLAFHLALVNNPQDALVVWTFSCVLYHGKWNEGVKVARELASGHVHFVPEILESSNDATDVELAEKVATFASNVLDSIYALTDPGSLKGAMAHHYPSSPCSELVFISKNAGKEAADVFNVLVNDIESLRSERHYHSIDYKLLREGDREETRFVLGKVIMDTMRGGITHNRTNLVTEKKNGLRASKTKVKQGAKESTSTVSELETRICKDKVKRRLDEADDQQHQQRRKKQKPNNSKPSGSTHKLVMGKLGKTHNLKKVVVKDVTKLLSLQKKVSLKESKLVKGKKLSEAQSSSMEMLKVLKSKPKTEKQKPEGVTEVLNVLRPFNHFKREKELNEKDVKQEKEQVVGDKPSQRVHKLTLSSIFK